MELSGGRLSREPLAGKFRKSSALFHTNVSPTPGYGGNAGGTRATEWVDDEIAGLAGAEHDWADEFQRKLGGEVRKAFAAVFDETGNAPDVVPEFTVRVGS